MRRNARGLPWFLLVALLALPVRIQAQQAECRLLCAPVFVLQPGLVTTNFIDAPQGAESDTDFLFRMTTAIPTSIPRTTLVGIVQWTPFAHERVGNRTLTRNSPAFVYGPVFNLINTPAVGLDFDVLGAYGPRARATDDSDYTHKLVLEGDLFLKVGNLTGMQGNLGSLALYGFLAYVATGLPDPAGEDNDPSRWVLLTGVSLPIAPWR